MKKTKRPKNHWCGFVALIALGAISACAPSPRLHTALPQLGPTAQRVAAGCASGRFSGVVAVQKHGRLLFLHHCGFADSARTLAVDPDASYKLFSTSKIFTAAAILSLVQNDRMALDDPIRKYVRSAPESWSTVTVRHLLQHQSGIPDFTEKLLERYESGDARTHAKAMDRVLAFLSPREMTLSAAPGSQWKYSNFGYELLARAAEIADGRPFHQVLERRVLRPAGMKSALVEMPDSDTADLASAPDPELAQGFNGSPENWEPASSFSFVQQGAGALHASYRDFLAFDRALSRTRLIEQALQQRNETESVPVNRNVRYGFGWMVRRVGACTYWQHSGGTNGYASEFARDPRRGYAVVILSNLGFAPVGELRREIMTLLLSDAGCRS